MSPFFLFCLVGFAAAADLTVSHIGVYLLNSCKLKDKKARAGYKNGNIFIEVGPCLNSKYSHVSPYSKNEGDFTKSRKYNCANDTAMGWVEYNTTDCKGPVVKTEVAAFSSVCKKDGYLSSMKLDSKCGAVMNCVTNATEKLQTKKHACTAKPETSDATAVSATVGLVISALALRL